ncbi:MAG: hypothetical protein CMJ24_09110 [Phycisphaerae bacterium]|nr:hypothetical protein [Phycisphaerae bacterium]
MSWRFASLTGSNFALPKAAWDYGRPSRRASSEHGCSLEPGFGVVAPRMVLGLRKEGGISPYQDLWRSTCMVWSTCLPKATDHG